MSEDFWRGVFGLEEKRHKTREELEREKQKFFQDFFVSLLADAGIVIIIMFIIYFFFLFIVAA